jgi:hypothetical protein
MGRQPPEDDTTIPDDVEAAVGVILLDSFVMLHPLCALLYLIPCGRVASYGEVARLLGLIHGIKTSGWIVGRVLS